MHDTANELKMIITQAGLDEVVAASQAGTDAVLITEVGYGTGQYTATPEQTQLQAEFKRLTTVAGGAVADNIIHCTVQDSTDDAYTVYEVGLYTDKGTLLRSTRRTHLSCKSQRWPFRCWPLTLQLQTSAPTRSFLVTATF